MRQPIRIILLMAVSAFLVAQTDPRGREGRLSYSDGPVSFQPAGVTDWVDANANRPLTTGDQVWAGDAAFNNIRYANRTVRDAVIAVPQNRFASGRRVRENARAVSVAQLGTARNK